MKDRLYYSLSHHYGGTTVDRDADPIGTYVAFDSASERDEWVSQGNPYFTRGGAREAVTADDKHFRRYVRRLIAAGCPDWRAELLANGRPDPRNPDQDAYWD